jgi:hypothetical protein
MFRSLLKEPDGGRHGCLLTNSAVELAGADNAMRSGVDAGLALLQRAFRAVLAEARAAGEVSPQLHPPAAALRLLVLYQGLLVLIRGGRPDRELAPSSTLNSPRWPSRLRPHRHRGRNHEPHPRKPLAALRAHLVL